VEDNGDGTASPGREGLGLRSMEYRANQLGASYRFTSAPGSGTAVELEITPGG